MGSKSTPIQTSNAPVKSPNTPKVSTNTPNAIKFLIGGSAGYFNLIFNYLILIKITFYRMAATLFVHPMDVVKNRMQMSGEGGATREHKTSFHATRSLFRNEGFRGIYAGYLI
jgi:solute carrier family 25 oxoglutarate transporter 11